MLTESTSTDLDVSRLHAIALISDIFPPKTGGSGRWFYEVYRRLPADRVQVIAGEHPESTVFDGQADVPLTHRFPLEIPDWGTIRPNAFLAYRRRARGLAEICKTGGVQVIHAGRILPEGWLARLIQKKTGLPYAVYVHGEDVRSAATSREHSWMVKRVFRSAKAVVANSENSARILREEWGQESVVLNPGVDCEYFVPAKRDSTSRAQLGWGDRPTILTVGRLQKRKGHDIAIRAIERVRKKIPDILYAICGDGEERATLTQAVDELGLHSNVLFMGEVDDATLLSAYQQCDLFALPNREVNGDIEGFGMVLVEAQACGRPVLAGNSGGTRETMLAGQSGQIVDCTSVDELFPVFCDLLLNHEFRRKMGEAGRDFVRSRFDWSILVAQAAQLFHGLDRPK